MMYNNIFTKYKLEEKKKLDPVDQEELEGDHDEREDQDIDNDGDVDDSDEYLHKRRKAVSKAMQKEDNLKDEVLYDKEGKKQEPDEDEDEDDDDKDDDGEEKEVKERHRGKSRVHEAMANRVRRPDTFGDRPVAKSADKSKGGANILSRDARGNPLEKTKTRRVEPPKAKPSKEITTDTMRSAMEGFSVSGVQDYVKLWEERNGKKV